MLADRVRRWGAGAGLAGVAAAAAALAGAGAVHADDTSTVDLNGWTVQVGPETPTTPLPPGTPALLVDFEKLTDLFFPNLSQAPATLTDPTDALGLGNEVPGSWVTVTPHFVPSGAFTVEFEPQDTDTSSPYVQVQDVWWLPWLEEAAVGNQGPVLLPGTDWRDYVLAPALGGKHVVALFEGGFGHTPYPIFNPDATGPIDVGGLPVASPQDGALFPDLFDAVFKFDIADWGKAATLFGDLLGLDPSSVGF